MSPVASRSSGAAGGRPWRRRILAAAAWIVSLGVLLMLSVGAYVTSPAFVTRRLAPWVEKKLGRQVSIRRVEPHWCRGFRLVGAQVFSSVPGAPPLLSVDSADVRISLTDLLRGKLTVASIEIQSPRLSAFRDSQGRLSIGDLLGELDKKKEKDKKDKEPGSRGPKPQSTGPDAPVPAQTGAKSSSPRRPPRFSVQEISVRDGQITFKDAALSPAIPIVLSIEDLDFTARGLGAAVPAPVSASFRARYQGVGLRSHERVEPIDLNLKLIQEGALALGLQEYRVETLKMELIQRGRRVGVGSLDQPFRIAWDQRAPTVQVNPAEFSLVLANVDLAQFNPQIFPKGADRITTGALSGDLSASVGGGGRLVDLAGQFKVSGLGMTQFEAIDLWGALGLSLDLRSRRLDRYSADIRVIKDGRAQGKIRLRGAGDPEQGGYEGSVSVERLDLTVLGANLAGMSRDIVVDSGKLDGEQVFSLSPDSKTLTTRGALTCLDLVFRGETPERRSQPLTVHVETDLRLDNGSLVGGGPLGRGARIETLREGKPLDEMTAMFDVHWPDPEASSLVQVRGASLSLDDYFAVRQTAREGQRLARRRRKAERNEIKELMQALRPEILTSATLDGAALSSPPRVPAGGAQNPASSPQALGLPPFAFEVEFDGATMAGERWEDLRLRGRFTDPRIETTTATARLGAGRVYGQAWCELGPSPRAFSWNIQTQGLEIDRALAGLAPEWKDRLHGRLDMECEGAGCGAGERELRDNLSARLQFRLAEGEARSLAPLTALARALDIPEFAQFRFGEMTGEAVLRKGRVELSRVEAHNDQQKLTLRGSIIPDGTIDWTFDAGIRGPLLDRMGNRPIVQALLKDAQGYSHFPACVQVLGTWEQADSRFGSPADSGVGRVVRIEAGPKKTTPVSRPAGGSGDKKSPPAAP